MVEHVRMEHVMVVVKEKTVGFTADWTVVSMLLVL